MQALLLVLVALPRQTEDQWPYPQAQMQDRWTAPEYQPPTTTPLTGPYPYRVEPTPSPPGVYEYEGAPRKRNIDGLPRSGYPLKPDEEEWGLTEADREPRIALHAKTTFRPGAEGVERLCIVEAQGDREDAFRAYVVLRDAKGREFWREPAPWLGPKGRFHAFWLPVRLSQAKPAQPVPTSEWDRTFPEPPSQPAAEPGDTLELWVGNEAKAWCRADLGAYAAKVVVEVRSLHEPLGVDQGWGLMPASQLLASQHGELEVIAATPEGLAQPARVNVSCRRLEGAGAHEPVLDEAISSSATGQTRRWRVACEGMRPGVYELVASAQVAGEPAAERRYRLHILQTVRTPDRFGAHYASLAYDGPVYMNYAETMPWERVWRGEKQRDVVVDFPGQPFRFVLWRGASYVPCWAFQNTWLSYEWLEAEPDLHGAVDCVEPIMDKYCRHSDAEIVETSPARVVLHWRYALTDFHEKVINDEHADEFFYLYPDAVGTRKLIGWIRGYGWHETQEFLLLNRAGNRPWQAVEPQALTFLSTDGQEQRPYWPEPRFSVDGWSDIICRVNILGQPAPFMTVPADFGTYLKVWAEPYANKPGLLNAYLHWPITHGIWTTWVDRDEQFERPTHSNLVNVVTDEVERAEDHKTWVWLIGIAPPRDRLMEVSASWLRPADVRVTGGRLASLGYDSSQRAYVLEGEAGPAALTLEPAIGSPVVNPVFVIDGWRGGLKVRLPGGATLATRVGSEDGGKRKVIFVEGRFDEPTTFEFVP